MLLFFFRLVLHEFIKLTLKVKICLFKFSVVQFVNLIQGSKMQFPTAATFFFKEHVISICKTVNGNSCQYHLIDSLPSNSSSGTRTTCDDIEALRSLLRWYTSRKFSVEECNRMDKTPWDESMADFDPRVFQGFVWEKPTQ